MPVFVPIPPLPDPISPPIISAVSQLDPLSGDPEIAITVINTQFFNLCGPVDASFETGIGTAFPLTNCAIGQSTAQALDGTHSIRVVALANGAMVVREGPYAVLAGEPYTITAAYRAKSAVESCRTDIEWLDNATVISTSTGIAENDSAASWVAAKFSPVTAPSNATHAYLLHNILNATGPLATPATPTATPAGTTGSATYNYEITATNAYGETIGSALGSTTTGNATLTSSNYNAVAWAADSGATGYNVYRSQTATCASIAADFATCLAVQTFFTDCDDLPSFVPIPTLITSTATNSLHDTGYTAGTQQPPTANTTGEKHYVDEVGLFPGTVTTWAINAFGTATILRSDGNYVLGASPLFPIILDPTTNTATVIDRTAAYGLPVSYTAFLISNQVPSSGSIPTTLVVMGQAPATVELYSRMGWAEDEDESGELLKWLAGVGELIQTVDTLCRDSYDTNGNAAPGWSQVLDIDRVPTYALPWLSQFVGVVGNPNLRDDIQRHQILNPQGFARGTPAAIIAVANQFMSVGFTATIVERDTSPYHLHINIPSAGVIGNVTCLSIMLEFSACSLLPGAFATCADMWAATLAINTAVANSIPAGLVCAISYA